MAIEGENFLELNQGRKQPAYQLILTWVLVIVVMNVVGYLLKKASLSTMVTSFLEEIVVLTIVCLANRFWLRVPIHLKSELSFWQQVKTNGGPVFFMVVNGSLLITAKHFTGHSALLVLLALLIAIFEELLFRGVLLGGFLRRFANNVRWGVWLAAISSSLLFAASHLINLSHQSLTMTVGQVLMAFGFGLLTSAMYLRTGSLLWTIAWHFLEDAQVLVNTGLLQQGVNLPAWAGIGPLVVYGGIAWFMLRRSKLADIRARFLN